MADTPLAQSFCTVALTTASLWTISRPQRFHGSIFAFSRVTLFCLALRPWCCTIS